MSNCKFVPTCKELEKDILDLKCKIALFNAHLIGENEKMEDGHHGLCALDKDVLGGHGQKLVEKVSRLILELENLKLNLKKFNELCKGCANNEYASGGRTVPPIQEEGAGEVLKEKAESAQCVQIRENLGTQRSSKKDSGIDVDESLSRPGSNLSQRSLSTTSEPCESEDPDNRRFSTRTEQLLTVQAQKASSRRYVKSKDKSSSL